MFNEFLCKIRDGLNAIEAHPLEDGEFNPMPGMVWRGVYANEGVAFMRVDPGDPPFTGTIFAFDPTLKTVRELGQAGRLHSQPPEGTIVVMKI